MAANVNPIFTLTGVIKWVTAMVTANADLGLHSGTSYDSTFTGGSDGSYVKEVRAKSSPGQNTAASVLRIWVNNGSTISTQANSYLFGEVQLPAVTYSASVPAPEVVYPCDFVLPSGYKIYFTIGVAPGGSGEFQACVVGGNY